MQGQQPKIDWRDGRVPVSRQFDDPYFSLENGLAEARHVFLGGNGLPERFSDGFRIVELGFGTGLNLLATVQAWGESGMPGQLNYTSFEAFPMSADDMALALTAFPQLADPAAELVAAWRSGARDVVFSERVTLQVIIGDARETLPHWTGSADAWFLDGFAPARNPELWTPELLASVARHTAPGGTAATYTAAGAVRRALADVGFAVARRPGYGRKRHMTVAHHP